MMFYLWRLFESSKKYFTLPLLFAENKLVKHVNEKILIEGNILNDIDPLTITDSSKLKSIDEIVKQLKPTVPVFCIRPKTIQSAATFFVSEFPGEVLYAVKCNPDPQILQFLWNGGIRHFDCASVKEIELIRNLLPSAQVHFMHPVKSELSISKAYFNYNVRDYAIDSLEELNKIKEITQNGNDLGLLIRIRVPENMALHDLSRKYGVNVPDAINILRQARPIAKRLGICFHVGSQCIEPQAFENALAVVKDIINQANVKIDIIDVGGGFPASYPDCIPPPLDQYFLSIKRGFQDLNMSEEATLWCEPGRGLVGAGCSVLVSVLARREDSVYINDGTYGYLGDAGLLLNSRYPTRLIRQNQSTKVERNEMKNFQFYGPTCENLDVMVGPFQLPDDVKTNDYIEIGQLGAYSAALRTGFNGYDETIVVLVDDDPLMVVLKYSE